MKTSNLFLISILAITMLNSCSAQTEKENKSTEMKADNIEIYYFHFTRRCATCNAVENVTKDAVAEFYGDKVVFAGYNLDEKDGKTKGKELGISGQALLIVAGDTQINITTEGFMNARSNPDKLKEIIKGKIDPLL